jgi:hypothetical protein
MNLSVFVPDPHAAAGRTGLFFFAYFAALIALASGPALARPPQRCSARGAVLGPPAAPGSWVCCSWRAWWRHRCGGSVLFSLLPVPGGAQSARLGRLYWRPRLTGNVAAPWGRLRGDIWHRAIFVLAAGIVALGALAGHLWDAAIMTISRRTGSRIVRPGDATAQNC